MEQFTDVREDLTNDYRLHIEAAEQLQADAWMAYDSAFHAPEGEEYRQAGRELTTESSRSDSKLCICEATNRTL